MKKLLVTVIAGILIISMFTLTGCGTKSEDKSNSRLVTEFTDNGSVDTSGEKWTRHSFYSDDPSLANDKAKDTASWFLMHGYDVTEIIEESTYNGGKYYYFKVRIAG